MMKKYLLGAIITGLFCVILLSGCADKEENNQEWYNYNMIAHAGGGIDGKTMTNSLEALNLAKENGFKLIEIDFQLTSDDVLVLKHDWSKESAVVLEQPVTSEPWQILDCETFKNTKVYRKYTTMTIEDLINWMDENPEIYIVTDSKEATEELIVKQFSRIVQACNGDESILDRFIVQIYNDDMLAVVKSIYDFPNVLYTIYQIAEPSEEFFHKLADYCMENNIKVVTIPKDYLWQPFIDILTEHDLIIYTHTINTITELERAVNMNVHGIYTDFLYESDLQYVEMNN